MVDLIGIEPMTSSMPWKRAPSCATGPLLGKDCFVKLAREGRRGAAECRAEDETPDARYIMSAHGMSAP